MTDLRDRIAAALKAANDRVAGFIGYDEMADALIRELGLIEQQSEWPFDGKHRYVTEWETTNE